MNRYLITAFASLLPDSGLPDEIVYLPEGNHAITPFVDGKPKKITGNSAGRGRFCGENRGIRGDR